MMAAAQLTILTAITFIPTDMRTLEIPKGCNIFAAARMAINEAQYQQPRSGEPVEFEFNELKIVARAGSCENDLAEIYALKSEIRRLENRL